MVRADLIDAMDVVLRTVRKSQHIVFGGVQVLFIGDLFQLPPVVKDPELLQLNEYYASPFFFHSRAVKESNIVCIELKKIYRQNDNEFIKLLHNVRNNMVTDYDLEILEGRLNPYFVQNKNEPYITLTTHNASADIINQKALNELPEKAYKVSAIIEGDFSENAYPTDKLMVIKEKAQIMFIKNDKGEARRYYNGKIGVIEKIDLVEKQIIVYFPQDKNSIPLEREKWKNIQYKYNNERDEILEEELGSFSQYPIRLAWAVTIHKSQGLTFDRAIIDAGRSFAAGQVYVALSRLTNLSGLVLKSKITPESIITDERVIEFAEKYNFDDDIDEMLTESQLVFAEQSLLKIFQWDKLEDIFNTIIEEPLIHNLLKNEDHIQLLSEIQEELNVQQKAATKFANQLESIIKKENELYSELHKETKQAAEWFIDQLNLNINTPLKKILTILSNLPRTKKYQTQIQELLTTTERKKQQLAQAIVITEALAASLSQHELMEQVSKLYMPPTIDQKEAAPETKKLHVGETKLVSLNMYREGKSIDEIAAIRNFTKTTIEGHLMHFLPTGEIDMAMFVNNQKFAVILNAINEKPEAGSSAIRQIIGEDYSYTEIRAVYTYWKNLQEKHSEGK